MSIASAFNEITVAQGGTASKTGSITGAIDKLNDVLAGSDQPGAETIEQAIRLLGQHIGGGSSVTVEALTATENKTYTAPDGKAYSPVTVNVSGGSSTVKCYVLDGYEQTTPFSPSDLSVTEDDQRAATILSDEVTLADPFGGSETYTCVSFTANVGSVYKIVGNGTEITSGEITKEGQMIYPSVFEDSALSFVSPNSDTVAFMNI